MSKDLDIIKTLEKKLDGKLNGKYYLNDSEQVIHLYLDSLGFSVCQAKLGISCRVRVPVR